MGKKLLSIIFIFSLFLLNSWEGFGQCTDGPNTNTSASISLDGSSTICSDETISFTSSITLDNAVNQTYQWQEKIGTGNWNDITGETGENLLDYSPQNNSKFRLLILFCNGTTNEESVASNISGTITIVEVTTATASISSDKTLVCPSESLSFTASLTNEGSSPGYSWLVNGVEKSTASTFSWDQFSDGDEVQLLLTSSRPCAQDGDSDSNNTVESNIVTIAVKPAVPDAPGSITGETQICPNTTGITYSINPVDRATSYEWNLPTGWTGSSTNESITITSGNVADNQVIKVKAINECGESGETTLAVNVGPGKPDTPGEISDPGIICPGDTISLEVALDSSVDSYTWTVPTGWSILSGQNTNQISVTAGTYGENGTVSVISTNSCLDSDSSSRSFTINEPVPANPGEISGQDIVCPNSDMTYSINAVTYANQYIWYLDGTEISGQNGTSITVDSGITSGSRTLKVIAVNECVNSADYATLSGSTKTIIVDDGTPAATSITQSNGEQNFCPGDPDLLFSVPTDAKIDTYSWQVPSGWTITAGTNTNQITVTAGQLGDDGQITFTGSSDDCGSVTATYDVFVIDPAPVINTQTISGETEVCHSDTALTYSIPEIQYATNYEWSAPDNWNIVSGKGTNSITVSAGTDDGNITVIAENDCGSSSPVILGVTSIDGVPEQPTEISSSLWDTETNSNDPICPPASGITFSVPGANGADSYNWILPAGWEITSGANTSSITVKVTATAKYNSSESVQVEAVNICGASTRQTYGNIVLSDYVQVDAGEDKTLCRTTDAITINGYVDFNGSKMKIFPATSGSGTFTNVPNGKSDNYSITYTPSQTDIDNLDEVVITVTTEAPVGACGPGEDEMIIFFRDNPSVSITGDTTICSGTSSTLTFSGTPNSQVTYTVNSGTNQNITIGSSGEVTLDSGNLTENTTYDLVSAVNTDTPSCSANISGSATITVTQVPTAEISYNDACTSETVLDVSLTGTNNYSGGTFSAPSGLSIDPASGTINPSTSTPGIHTVTYTIPASEGCEEIDVTTEVNILEKVVISSEPTVARACEGGNVQFEVTATGEGLSYQWYKNSAAAGNEVGNNSNLLELTNLSATDAGEYLVVISGTTPCTSETSLPAELTVDENIVFENQPEAISVCENGTEGFSISATSGGTALGTEYSYQWFKGSPGSGSPVAGATSPSMEITSASLGDAGDYYVEISGPAEYQCDSATSEAATLTVRETPQVEISGDAEICSGNSTDITFSNGVPNGIVTYTINNNNTAPQTFALDANGAGILNTGTLVATSGTDTEFLYTVQSVAYPNAPECSTSVSGSATVTVAPDPDVSMSFDGDQTEFCTVDTATYTPVLEGTGTYSGGKFSAPGITLDENTGAFVPANQNPGNYTLTYTIPPYGGCTEKTVTLSISIYEEVKITSQPYNIGICSTEDAEFSVSATGDELKYQWFKNGAPIAGAENASLNLPVATSEDAGEYFVRISGTNACTPTEETMVDSDVVTLNVDEDIVIIEPAEDVSVCETGDETVEFRFVAHANGAPLNFTWIYGNGSAVAVDGVKIESSLTTEANYNDSGIEVYIGTLTIHNIVEADENMYAVQIDGSGNDFTCPMATSNAFKLEVNPLPDAPVVENIEYCLNEEAIALTATGTNLLWYDSPDDETPSENAPVPTTTAAGEFTYYVSQTPLYCESELAAITVTVNERPAVPELTAAEKNPEFCLGETATALTATPEDGATLNWYDSAGSTTPLDSAPVPPTNAAGNLEYWVSQTNTSGCEGEKEVITVIINDLPAITPPNDVTICSGDTIEVSAVDNNETSTPTTFTWDWEGNTGDPLSGTTVSLGPTETTIYTITGTNGNGCVNTSQFTISVDDLPIGGTIAGPSNVCITEPSGTLELSEHSGEIIRWEFKTESATEWAHITNQEQSYDFTIDQATTFRAVIGRGVCDEVYSSELLIKVDPEPIGGELAFDGLGRTIETCSNPGPEYNIPLSLSGQMGEIIRWRFKEGSDTEWSTVMEDGSIFTGTTLSPALIRSLGINQSTIFEVEMGSGACIPNVFSQNATLSIVSSGIAPDPVSVTPGVVCIGEEVTLSGSTGYGSGPGFEEGGSFDFSSITNKGWRIKDSNGNESNFDSSADNGVAAIWLRTNPLPLTTANLTPPYNTYTYSNWDSSAGDEGNKGFAIVSGPNPSTLETSIFNLYAVENPVLTFDQAYNLTPGSAIYVEISTDGGATYAEENILSELVATDDEDGTSGNYDSFGDDDASSKNKIVLDLTAYASLPNLRIRFRYEGTRDGDVWAVDAISLPVEPTNVDLTWRDYTDPENPVIIGTDNSEQWTPKLIGWNDFEIRTRLTFDSTGEQCPVVENFSTINVFVFDQYTSTATADAGSCGNKNIQLNAVVLNRDEVEVSEFPTRDNYTASWEIISSPDDYTFSETHFINEDSSTPAINDPNAVFSPGMLGAFTLRWKLEREADDDLVNENCPPTYTDAEIVIEECIALDFDGFNDYVDLGTSYAGSSYSIEAWIRPFDREIEEGTFTDASKGTIISGPGFEIKMEDLPAYIQKNNRWFHIAYTRSGVLYVDGIPLETNNISNVGGNETLIGARWNSTAKQAENHFSGWIEEVRIWKADLTQDQIRFMMNQRLYNNGTQMGVEIPMDVPDGLSFTDLAGYYQLLADPGLITGGTTPDLANTVVDGLLVNMETLQENTAPLPYLSKQDGAWTNINTWLRPDVWDIPNSTGISGDPIEWNIVKTFDNITSDAKDITVLGLKSETIDKLITMANPGGPLDETNTGQMMRVTHYLLLNGNMDLVGESQLLQDSGSILAEESAGWLERDQQGKRNSFVYNYWSSPVSIQGAPNNSGYTVGGILLDGTTSSNPQTINFQTGYAAADGGKTNPITISTYWIWGFSPAPANVYAEWDHVEATGLLNTGEGYTMKGSDGTAGIDEDQNYTFKGKPHNGDFELPITVGQNYLVGNPYPSAIDGHQFIRDNGSEISSNGVFDGTIYFWDHFVKVDHILQDYIGGYAYLNLSSETGVSAISNDDRINANDATSSKKPQRYIPVSQGFMINTTDAAGGEVKFRNSQRVYVKETGSTSIFLSHETREKTTKNADNEPPRIRLNFKSPTGYHRQILAAAISTTTNGFDWGYDALLRDNSVEDMFWMIDEDKYVIQAVPDFNEDQVLPLGVRIKGESEFTFKIDTLENWPADKPVYLKDHLTDSIHNLRKSEYKGTSEPGEILDRFEIVFHKEPDAIIPEEPKPDAEVTNIEIRYHHESRELIILNPDLIPIDQVMIFDMIGKRIQDFKEIPQAKEIILNTRPIGSSVYIVKILTPGGVKNIKFLMK